MKKVIFLRTMFCTDLRTNRDYLPTQHVLWGFSNPDGASGLENPKVHVV